ncbi:DedA family protein [Georgenia faecalis]|uniref:DedA family protein n=1 Tax=Georgenia faecalis TaxID=2483799 RepID=A0ABV9D8M5_9MICO|nr:VTT domain-containing protein [Georgenia faecalis]
MTELMAAVEESVLGLAGSPWILLAVFVLATIDGFFPPVPSESVVIAVAVLAITGEGPSLWLLIAAAAAGAFSGDLIAFGVGTKVPIHRLRMFQGDRGQGALAWASRALATRGTVFILSARFVPVGRVAVNMTAGAVAYPRRRFIVIAAIAAVIWGGYSTLLGMGAGVFLHEHPLVAVAVGVLGGVLLGFVVDAVLKRVSRRMGRADDGAAVDGPAVEGGAPEGPPAGA